MCEAASSLEEFLEWAGSQRIRFGVVGGRRMRLPEEQQAEARLGIAGDIARRAFGCDAMADTWLRSPSEDLGGVSPAAFVTESDEGSRLALLALVRQRRRAAGAPGV